ncbi:hypothetical protein MBANPS3_003959 [Mucor bainieri]
MAKINHPALQKNQALSRSTFQSSHKRQDHVVSDLQPDRQTLPASETIPIVSNELYRQQTNTSKVVKKKSKKRFELAKLKDTWNTPESVQAYSGRRLRQRGASSQAIHTTTQHVNNEPAATSSTLASINPMATQDIAVMPSPSSSSPILRKRKTSDDAFDDTLIANTSDSPPNKKSVVVKATDEHNDTLQSTPLQPPAYAISNNPLQHNTDFPRHEPSSPISYYGSPNDLTTSRFLYQAMDGAPELLTSSIDSLASAPTNTNSGTVRLTDHDTPDNHSLQLSSIIGTETPVLNAADSSKVIDLTADEVIDLTENEATVNATAVMEKPNAQSSRKANVAGMKSTFKAETFDVSSMIDVGAASATGDVVKEKSPRSTRATSKAKATITAKAPSPSSLTSADDLGQKDQVTAIAAPERPTKEKHMSQKKIAKPVEKQETAMQVDSKAVNAAGKSKPVKHKEQPESSSNTSHCRSTRQQEKPMLTEKKDDHLTVDVEDAEEDQVTEQAHEYITSRDSFLVKEDFKTFLPQLMSQLPIQVQAGLAKLLPPPDQDGATASNPIPEAFFSPSNTHFWEAATRFQEVLGLGGFEPATIKKRKAKRAATQPDDPFKDDDYEAYWGERLKRDKKQKVAAKAKEERAACERGGRRGNGGSRSSSGKGKGKAA